MNRRYQPLEPVGGQRTAERQQREPRRTTPGVPRDERQAVDQRQRVVGRIEVGQHVGHRGEHREPGAPARLAVAGAEVHAGAHDVARRHAVVEQAEHGLGDDERDALLQALLQATQQVAGAVALGLDDDGHPTVVDLDRVGPHVVGPRIERAARAHDRSGRCASGRSPARSRPSHGGAGSPCAGSGRRARRPRLRSRRRRSAGLPALPVRHPSRRSSSSVPIVTRSPIATSPASCRPAPG